MATDNTEMESNAYLQSIGMREKGGSTTPPTMTSIDSFKAQTAGLDKREQEVLQARQEVTGQEISDIEAHKAREQKLFGRQLRALDERPQLNLQDVQKPPVQQPKNPFEAFQNPAVWLALMASAFTRAPLTAALNAGAAAMKGLRDGNKEEMERKREEWKDQTAQALEQNKIEMERYEAAWKKADRDVALALAALQGEAAAFKNDNLIALTRRGDLDAVSKYLDGLRKSDTEIWKAMETMSRYERSFQQRETFHKDSVGTPTPFSEKALDGAAQIWLDTGKLPSNIARTKANAPLVGQIINRGMELAEQKGIDDLPRHQRSFAARSAGLRTLEQRQGRLIQAINNTEAMGKVLKEASDAAPRTKFTIINRGTQEVQAISSDPRLARFTAAINGYANVYAQAMAIGGQPRIHDKEHFYDEVVNKAMGTRAIDAVIEQVNVEISKERLATRDAIEELGGEPLAIPKSREGEQKAAPPKAEPAHEGWGFEEVK